MKRKDYYYYY